MKRCSGVRHPLNPWTQWDENLFKSLVNECRHSFVRENQKTFGLLFTGRFDNDKDVELRIRSSATADQFTDEPIAWIRAALLDCAQAEYWYRHEKVWEEKELS